MWIDALLIAVQFSGKSWLSIERGVLTIAGSERGTMSFEIEVLV